MCRLALRRGYWSEGNAPCASIVRARSFEHKNTRDNTACAVNPELGSRAFGVQLAAKGRARN